MNKTNKINKIVFISFLFGAFLFLNIFSTKISETKQYSENIVTKDDYKDHKNNLKKAAWGMD